IVHAVANRFAQPRIEQHLGIVVRVDVEKAGHEPLARPVDHVTASPLVERSDRDHRDGAVADADVANLRRATGPVEPPSIADDDVEAHGGTIAKIGSAYAPRAPLEVMLSGLVEDADLRARFALEARVTGSSIEIARVMPLG